MAEPGLGKGHDGALLGHSFGLWIGSEARFDAPTLIAASHELAHSWLGGAVRLVDGAGNEQAWFSEGFAVHYARKVALREKLISPDEFATDVERTLGLGVSDLGSHPIPRSREAYQRGALYAAQIDAVIEKASKKKRSLDDLLRKLFAHRSSGPFMRVPVKAFRDLIAEELGAGRGEELMWVMVQGHGEIRLEDETFGKCFHRSRTKTKVFELGFDRQGTLRPPQMIRGLVAGSAAARAGLVEGALILSSKLPDEFDKDTDKPVEIAIALRGRSKKIRYLPVGEREDVHWADKKGCTD
jgi:predicted metalloprotease with PDZ domain